MGSIPHYASENRAQHVPMQKQPVCKPSTDPVIYYMYVNNGNTLDISLFFPTGNSTYNDALSDGSFYIATSFFLQGKLFRFFLAPQKTQGQLHFSPTLGGQHLGLKTSSHRTCGTLAVAWMAKCQCHYIGSAVLLCKVRPYQS